MAEKCGAKTRDGSPCARLPVPGKKRCRLHGGASTGPRDPEKLSGNTNAVKHGFWRRLTAEDMALGEGGPDDKLEALATAATAVAMRAYAACADGVDPDAALVVVKAAGAAERLIKAQMALAEARQRGLRLPGEPEPEVQPEENQEAGGGVDERVQALAQLLQRGGAGEAG